MIELFQALSKKNLIAIITKCYDENVSLKSKIKELNDYSLKPTEKEISLQSELRDRNKVIKELRATITRQNNKGASKVLDELRRYRIFITDGSMEYKEDKQHGDWVDINDINNAKEYIKTI
jgi:hypothetical protein